MDRAPPVFKNNVQVFYLILDKKRASSLVIRKQRTPSQKRETGPSNFMRKKRAPFTAQSARRDLLPLWVRDVTRKKRAQFTPQSGRRDLLSL